MVLSKKEKLSNLLKNFESEESVEKLLLLIKKVQSFVKDNKSLAEPALKQLSVSTGRLKQKNLPKDKEIQVFKEVSAVVFTIARYHLIYLEEKNFERVEFLRSPNSFFDPIERLYMMTYHVHQTVGSLSITK